MVKTRFKLGHCQRNELWYDIQPNKHYVTLCKDHRQTSLLTFRHFGMLEIRAA